jgi:FixJ family two-component response regulator
VSDDAPLVLVVVDASVLTAVARLLRSEGLRVATFASAQQFLAEARPDAADCLVLDVRMPGLDGLELQRALNEVNAASRSSSSRATATSRCASGR